MKKAFFPQLAAVLALAFFGTAAADTWKIDPAHSDIGFRVVHLMISEVSGSFRQVEGSVSLEGEDLSGAAVEATIQAGSLDTGSDRRDGHLKSPDFFDVEKYPDLTFKSTRVTKAGEGGLKLAGQLTLHGVTRDVVLDVKPPTAQIKDPFGGTRVGVTATTTIDRKDFGITWNKALDSGGVMISDEVNITLRLELVKQEK